MFERDAGLTVATAEIPKNARVGRPFEASFELANSGGFALSGMALSDRLERGDRLVVVGPPASVRRVASLA